MQQACVIYLFSYLLFAFSVVLTKNCNLNNQKVV